MLDNIGNEYLSMAELLLTWVIIDTELVARETEQNNRCSTGCGLLLNFNRILPLSVQLVRQDTYVSWR